MLWGISGVRKEVALASRSVIATVEEIVDTLDPRPSAVCRAPGGARPSYALGYYRRDNAFYEAWDGIARDRARFTAWMERHVLGTEGFSGYERSVAAAAVAEGGRLGVDRGRARRADLRRGAGVVERGGLEYRCTRERTVGSNPPPPPSTFRNALCCNIFIQS